MPTIPPPPSDSPQQARREPPPLACGCEWVTKYCDEHHYKIRQQAHDHAVREAVLKRMAAELRFEAEHNAKTSRDFGRGMSWAATMVESRAGDPWYDEPEGALPPVVERGE